jgi:hypothetical protein
MNSHGYDFRRRAGRRLLPEDSVVRLRRIRTMLSCSDSGGSSSRSSIFRTSRIQVPHHLHWVQSLAIGPSCPRRRQTASSLRLIMVRLISRSVRRILGKLTAPPAAWTASHFNSQLLKEIG